MGPCSAGGGIERLGGTCGWLYLPLSLASTPLHECAALPIGIEPLPCIPFGLAPC